MWISDPAPPPEFVRGSQQQIPVRRHYWRSLIFDRYTGRGWELAVPSDTTMQPIEGDLPGRYPLEQRYELIARHTNTLFAANQPVQASEGVFLRSAGVDGSLVVSGAVDQYSVISQATDVTVLEMNQAGTALHAWKSFQLIYNSRRIFRSACVHCRFRLPEMDRRMSGLRASRPTCAQITPMILGCEPRRVGRDVVDYFLFDGQSGFCSHFATAMAVMLRSVGVPARVAAGYAMGSYIPNLMMYAVPASSSHAWVEVYFPGYRLGGVRAHTGLRRFHLRSWRRS